MRRRRIRLRNGFGRTLGRGLAWLLGAALAGPAPAAEMTLQNDSTLNGIPSTVANVFLAGESAAAWHTATCNGDIVAARVYWTSQFGGNPASLEFAISLFSGGTHPTPGPVLLNQGGANAVIAAPVLADQTMHEFRFLDPPADTQALRVPVTAGQAFVVSLEFLNTNSALPFASSVGWDVDGCLPGRGAVDVMPGGWSPLCPLGAPGDFVIQAVVDCAEPAVPALSGPGRAGLAAALAALAALAGLTRSRGSPFRRRSGSIPSRGRAGSSRPA